MQTSRRTRVLVVYGGKSSEHEISILSARFVVGALDRQRFEPVLVAIARSGRWHLQDEARLLGAEANARTIHIDEAAPVAWLEPGGLRVAGREGLEVVDVAFPVLHGPFGEDGTVQGLFEMVGLAYVGAGVLGAAVTMDKEVQKRVCAHAELPVLPWVALRRDEWTAHRDEALETCEHDLRYPVFVKPACLGSSVGVRRARSREELVAAIEHAFGFDEKIVVERGLERPREIEVAVLGNHAPTASVPGELRVEHPDGFYSYDAKYVDDGARPCIPADLYHAEVASVQLLALRAYRVTGLQGMARVDLFLDEHRELWLNELNAIPGMTAISMFPMLWKATGLDGAALVSRLVELGLERHAARAALRSDPG